MLFNLQFIESQFASDQQLNVIREALKSRDLQVHEKLYAMNRYYFQFVKGFYIKENVVCMDDKLFFQKT